MRLARVPVHASSGRSTGAEQETIGENTTDAPADRGLSGPEPSPILVTKLYIPRPRAALVARPRLLARLEGGLAGPLTLVTAPAGFGKTTVLAEWLQPKAAGGRIQAETSSTSLHPASFRLLPPSVAWLGLDAGDSDPLQFLRYLVAALQTIVPSTGRTVLNLLGSPQPPPIETLMPLLINDLVKLPEPSILVLDDYHVVEAPAVHQALAFLLEHLPPQLHLVIASRVDPPLPLSRLRARGQLTELRAHDLRFTPDEAAQFLREAMGVPATAEDVAVLEARTEGWIAGLQLAALSLRDRPSAQRTQFIDVFAGTNRFVVDYLVDEVLARQPPHLQTFLLHTSILQRLCGPLCDAVLGGDGREATGAGYVRVFVDEGAPMRLLILDFGFWIEHQDRPSLQPYVQTLLAAFPVADGAAPIQNPKSTIQNLTEPLTERELEVLRLLAAGNSNQAIARELIVAVGTVKRHLNSIFGKLGVRTRLEAVTRAHDLGLV